MKKKFWTSDKVVSFVAIMISLFTLYIFVRQTNIIEEQSRRSVMPYLMMESSNNSENMTYSIEIVNYGVGPAIVESRVIYYKNKVYDMEFHDFLQKHIPEMDSVNLINYTTLQIGVAIPSSAERNILVAGGDQSSYSKFLGIMKKLRDEGFNYEIKYKSIYEERWAISAEEDIPILIED
jgi:hypothetical protein